MGGGNNSKTNNNKASSDDKCNFDARQNAIKVRFAFSQITIEVVPKKTKREKERKRKVVEVVAGGDTLSLSLSLFQLATSVQILVQLVQLLAIDFGAFVLFSLGFFSLSLSFSVSGFLSAGIFHRERIKSAKFHDLRQIASILSSKLGEDMPTVHVLWYLLHATYASTGTYSVYSLRGSRTILLCKGQKGKRE